MPEGFQQHLVAALRFLDDVLPQQLWTSTADGHLDFVNRHVLDYFGRSEQHLLVDGWQDLVHPDDLGECRRLWARALATGEPYQVEFRLRDAGGRYRWHLGRARAVRNSDGVILRWCGTNTDIDDQKRVEQSHRFLLDASAVLAHTLDLEETLASVARLAVPHVADWCVVHLIEGDELRQVAVAHVDPSKVSYAHELARRYPSELSDPTGVAEVIRSGQPQLIPEITDEMLVASARDAEHLRIARDLGLRSYMCVPLQTRERTLGAITFVDSHAGRRYGPADLAVAEDLAARCAIAIDNATLLRHAQTAEQQSRQLSDELERRVGERTGDLARARDRLEAANNRLREQGAVQDDLLGALSFQLAGPLEGIAGDVDNLLEGIGGLVREEPRAHLRRIAASSRLMLSLVHDLLDRNRMTGGNFELDRETTDLCALVRDALRTLDPLLATQGQRVVTRFPEEPVDVDLDPVRIEQVLTAILHNVIQMTTPGALLRVAVDTDHGEVRCEIQHTGERLEEADITRLFRRFTHHNGAWLGLSTAHGIVQAHGGRIGIEPSTSGGNVFWFTLPRPSV
jgi:PAS domain S-box-containing protein